MLRYPLSTDFNNFYQTVSGSFTFDILSKHILKIWEKDFIYDQTILGIGYAEPFLTPFEDNNKTLSIQPYSSLEEKLYKRPSKKNSIKIDTNFIPIVDESVDRIIIVHLLEYISDVKIFIAEINRILVPNGKIILIIANSSSPILIDHLIFDCCRKTNHNDISSFIESTDLIIISFESVLFSLHQSINNFIDRFLNKCLSKVGKFYIIQLEKQVLVATGISQQDDDCYTTNNINPVLQSDYYKK